MPEKARFYIYIAVKEPASNLNLQALISRLKLGFSFAALLINIRTQISKIRIDLKTHLLTGNGMLKHQQIGMQMQAIGALAIEVVTDNRGI